MVRDARRLEAPEGGGEQEDNRVIGVPFCLRWIVGEFLDLWTRRRVVGPEAPMDYLNSQERLRYSVSQ